MDSEVASDLLLPLPVPPVAVMSTADETSSLLTDATQSSYGGLGSTKSGSDDGSALEAVEPVTLAWREIR